MSLWLWFVNFLNKRRIFAEIILNSISIHFMPICEVLSEKSLHNSLIELCNKEHVTGMF